MIGSVIGNYRLVGELGKGGMGVVYVAEHVQLGRPAALKMLLPQFSADEAIVQRFFNEARAASAIDHPGIVEIYDFGTHTDGRAYIVMALLKGETLYQRLSRAPLSPVEGATIVAQVASALAAAHARGIVHRDLKPDNIFLVPNELMPCGVQAKLLDFGIAKLADERASFKTQTGSLIGTPAYMSPEQCMGRSDLDHRTDLYALGCILFHVLCGRPPFISDAGAGPMIAAHLRDPAPDPRGFNPYVPEPLAHIVLRLLEKQPAARFQTATELRDALMLAGANVSLTGSLSAQVAATGSRHTGPDAYLPTTAPIASSGTAAAPSVSPPTTSSGSAAQMVSTPAAASSKKAVWIFVAGAALAAAGLIAVVATSSEDDAATRAAQVEGPPGEAIPSGPSASSPSAPTPASGSSASGLPGTGSSGSGPPGSSASGSSPSDSSSSPAGSGSTTDDTRAQSHRPHRDDDPARCPAGQSRRPDTHGQCCWPEQAWSMAKRRCVGTPRCPSGMRVAGDRCESIAPERDDATPTPVPVFVLDENAYDPGADVVFRFAKPVPSSGNRRAWVTIIGAGEPKERYGAWTYVPDQARSVTLKAPAVPGRYEARVHTDYSLKSTNLRHSVPFYIVGGEAPPQQVVTPLARQRFRVARTRFAPGASAELRFPAPMHAATGERFWVTVVAAGAEDRAFGAYDYVAPGARSIELAMPTSPGDYELRLHANYPKKAHNVVHRVRVQVQ